MLIVGSRVLVREEGQYLHVEQLSIGGFIFDPFADRYCEITDILSRRINLPDASSRKRHPLRPVVIAAGHFGADRPRVNVAVSPFQELMVPAKLSCGSGIPTIGLQSAERILDASGAKKRFRKNQAHYFAIFTESVQYMDVDGVLMPSYSADLFDQAQNRSASTEVQHYSCQEERCESFDEAQG